MVSSPAGAVAGMETVEFVARLDVAVVDAVVDIEDVRLCT